MASYFAQGSSLRPPNGHNRYETAGPFTEADNDMVAFWTSSAHGCTDRHWMY